MTVEDGEPMLHCTMLSAGSQHLSAETGQNGESVLHVAPPGGFTGAKDPLFNHYRNTLSPD